MWTFYLQRAKTVLYNNHFLNGDDFGTHGRLLLSHFDNHFATLSEFLLSNLPTKPSQNPSTAFASEQVNYKNQMEYTYR